MTDPQINSWDRLPPVPMDTTWFDVACRDRSPLGAAVLLIAPFTKVMQTLAFGANEQVRRAAAVSKEMETFLAALKAADADIHPNRLVRLAVWAMLAAFVAAAITNGW